MNWTAIGAIAEVSGVIAIFVSLVYVGIQIRQNTRQISLTVDAYRLSAFERSVESGNHIRELLITNQELTELFLTGLESFINLGPTQQMRFSMLLRNMFSGIQGAYVRQRSVEHDPLGFEGQERLVDSILKNPGAREWLDKNDPDWHPEFRGFVADRLKLIEQKLTEAQQKSVKNKKHQ